MDMTLIIEVAVFALAIYGMRRVIKSGDELLAKEVQERETRRINQIVMGS